MLAAVVACCILAVVVIVHLAGAFSDVPSGSRTLAAQEERADVTTNVVEFDTDKDGLLDVAVDVNELDESAVPPGEGWQVGAASAYDLNDNDGGEATASGIPLDETSLTVAVPEALSASHLGSYVEVYYGGICVKARITDTGVFDDYGRALDFAPGVWHAFGADSVDDWGVRDVFFRYVDDEDA